MVQFGLRFLPGAQEVAGSNPAGPTTSKPETDLAKLYSRIFGVLDRLRREGYSEYTIEATGQRLRYLSRHVDLECPEEVLDFIMNQRSWSRAYKQGMLIVYKRYAETFNIRFTPPKLRITSRPLQIPREEDIDLIISSCRFRNSLAFRILKETGLRPIELHDLTLRDIDLNQGLIHVKTRKYGKPRTLKLKSKTKDLLRTYINMLQIKSLDQKLFPNPKTLKKTWERARKRTAIKFNKPELLKIRLYDLRHFFATKEYRKTRDILYVKEMLGHKTIQHIIRYIHTVIQGETEYTCKIAKTVEEAKTLVEAGFEYVCEIDGVKLFRKPK